MAHGSRLTHAPYERAAAAEQAYFTIMHTCLQLHETLELEQDMGHDPMTNLD